MTATPNSTSIMRLLRPASGPLAFGVMKRAAMKMKSGTMMMR